MSTKIKRLSMKCRYCGRFLAIQEAEESTGRLADAFRNKVTCKKCATQVEV